MAKGRDRPRKEPKRKPKEKAPKQPGTSGSVNPGYQAPTRPIEVKPRRKERDNEPQDPNPQSEG